MGYLYYFFDLVVSINESTLKCVFINKVSIRNSPLMLSLDILISSQEQRPTTMI